MSCFSQRQQIILAIVPGATSVLSILGSSSIIYVILSKRKTKLTKTYHRILLSMSIMDLLQSLAHSLSTLPIPSGTECVYGALGNTQTCTAQGFFLTIGYAVPMYNVALSFHFVVSILDQKLPRGLKHCFFIIPFILPFTLGIAGLIGEEYNNLGTVCFFGEFPRNCDKNPNVECTRGLRSNVYLYIIGIFLIVALFIVPINMFRLFYIVKRQEQNNRRKYNYPLKNVEGAKIQSTLERQVLFQALCYVCSFLLVYLWTIIDAIIWAYAPEYRNYVLVIISKIFYPMQGFFNLLIFIRPRTKRLRKENPTMWFHCLVIKAIFDRGDIQPIVIKNPIKAKPHTLGDSIDELNPYSIVHKSDERQHCEQDSKMIKRDSLILYDNSKCNLDYLNFSSSDSEKE